MENKNKQIKEIYFDDEFGNPQTRIIGNGINKIIYHSAQGEGDRWYWDIYHDDGKIETIFYPRRVVSYLLDDDIL